MSQLHFLGLIFLFAFYIMAIALRLADNHEDIPVWTWPGLFLVLLMGSVVLVFGLFSVFILLIKFIGA